jgi:hypothetical protein
MKYSMIMVIALTFIGNAAFADCPDKTLACRDGTGIRIGTCWKWESLSCKPCDLSYRRKCNNYGGFRCLSSNLTGLHDIGDTISGWFNNGRKRCD